MDLSNPPRPLAPPTIGAIVLLGALTAFAAISIDLYLPSLPAIGVDLGASPAAVQSSMSAFLVGLALGQLVLGPVSDRWGRRPVLLGGAALYVVASIGCAVAPSIEWLVAGRFVEALGACAGQVVARAVVRDRYDHQESARIFSAMTLVMGVAPLVAPSIGAWLVSFASWRFCFAVLAAFGTLVGLAVLLRLPESRSAATAAMARSESIAAGFGDLLRQRRLLGYLLTGALNGATLFTYITVVPDLAIVSYGLTPREFGWLFSLNAVGVIGASQVNRLLLARYSSDQVLAGASIGGAVAGAALLVVAASGVGGIAGVLVLLFVVLTSYGFMSANTIAGALSVDPLRAGASSSLIGATSAAVGALVAAIAGLFHDGTAVPLAAVMAVSLAGSVVALFALALPPRGAASDP